MCLLLVHMVRSEILTQVVRFVIQVHRSMHVFISDTSDKVDDC